MTPAAPKTAPLLHMGHPHPILPKFGIADTPSPAPRRPYILIAGALAIAIAFLGQYFHHLGEHAPTPNVSWPWMIPFALLLLCIAIMPFLARHFWERSYAYIAIGLALLVAGYYLFAQRSGAALAKSLAEYISFIFLLASLFITSGGILISVRRKATPAVNVLLLLTGAILANVLGTTGAAMLLIRPYLRINKGHIRPYHIIFFIFIVANVGGCLTPIGDPPLFLGYLKGVPFWWVAEKCWPMWATAIALLLAIFFIIDTLSHRNEKRAAHNPEDPGPAISLYGASNLLLVFAVLAGILLHDQLTHFAAIPWREIIMVLASCASLLTTPHRIHVENVFNFAPIREVALLFVGIFITMVPALNFLSNHAQSPALQQFTQTPGQIYFTSGTLSSVLDNAPTYLTFLEMETSRHQADVPTLLRDPKLEWLIIALSLGSVFFGAMTYIGNGPNFMVRSIAENAGIKCPSFFGYILLYSIPILLPILILIWALFLRPHAP